MAFVDNLRRVLLVLGFAREGKGVFGLSISCAERLKVNKDITVWVVEGDEMNGRLLTDLVNPEPLVCGSDETREVPLDIFDVV